MCRLSRCAIVFSLMMVFGVPLSAVAQDTTPTTSPSATITVNLPTEQIVGADNPIDLNTVAQACDPDCEIGLEVVYWVDPYNRVDENKALVIGFDRELHPTVPPGMSAILFRADGLNVLIPVNSTDRAPQGTWVVAIFIQGDIGDEAIRPYLFVIDGPRCSGYKCELEQFAGIDVYSTAQAHCGSIKAPIPNSLALYQAEENGPWVIEVNDYNFPSFCGRIWFFWAIATFQTG